MKRLALLVLAFSLVAVSLTQAATIVVNSTNNAASPPPGETNLFLAMTLLQNGDTITFNIDTNTAGPGPYYLEPPNGGFPMITKNNVTIDGYTQPGSSPNTATFLSANNAKIKIVLSATNSVFHELYRDMDYNSSTNQGVGFTPQGEYGLLGIYGASNIEIKGLCLLGNVAGLAAHYAVAMAQDTTHPCNNDHISGCWIGVEPDGNTTHTFDDCLAAFSHKNEISYRFRGTNGATSCGFDITVTNRFAGMESDWFSVDNWMATNTVIASCSPTNFTITTNVNPIRFVHTNHIIGVKSGAHDLAAARAQQNVMVGGTIEVVLEGQAFRVAGNRVGVFPDGMRDYITPFAEPGRIMEGVFEIGRGASDCIIGTDGDGNNDAEERNIFGGVVTDGSGGSHNLNGYSHTIEFYSASGSPGTDRSRNRIAGNYIGIAVDGVTRFTNGVPFCNASTTGASQYWVGSDFDGVSDDIEANVIYNNYSGNPPTPLFYDTIFTNSVRTGGGSHGFFDQSANSGIYSLRGNVTVNNYPFPVNPRTSGYLSTYVTKAMATPLTASNAVLSLSSTTARIKGTAPVGKLPYKWTTLDFYLADLEGMTNGVVFPDVGLPNGWVQGKKYLGSYMIATTNKNNAPNLVTNAGQFELNACDLGLTNGSTITVTVNYSQDAPGTHNARVLTTPFSPPLTVPAGVVITSVTRSGNVTTITWCGGVAPYKLQRASAVTGPYVDIQTGLPGPSTTDTTSDTNAFYRVIGTSN